MNARNVPRSKVSSLLHVVFWIVLASWDLQTAIRKKLSRSLLRILTGFLALILLVLVVTSISSLSKIGDNMQSLRGDSLVGLEVAVKLRGVVREMQLEVLRHSGEGNENVSAAELADFRRKVSDLIESYRAGVFDASDAENVRKMEQALNDYERAISAMSKAAGNNPANRTKAEATGSEMLLAVGQAYDFNRLRLRASADEAGLAAQSALRLTKFLWTGSAVFILVLFALVLLDRWVARTELVDSFGGSDNLPSA